MTPTFCGFSVPGDRGGPEEVCGKRLPCADHPIHAPKLWVRADLIADFDGPELTAAQQVEQIREFCHSCVESSDVDLMIGVVHCEALLRIVDALVTSARKNADGLLPCPFCGWQEPQAQFDAAAPDGDPCLNNGYVHCLECGAFGPTGSTLEEGVELWNERISFSPDEDVRHSSAARWLNGGQLHCDAHRQGIPYFFAAPDAVCAECSNDAPESYVKRLSRDEAKGAQGGE